MIQRHQLLGMFIAGACLLSSTTANASLTYFVIHGMGEGTEDYQPSGAFFEAVHSTVQSLPLDYTNSSYTATETIEDDLFTSNGCSDNGIDQVVTHTWHTPEYQQAIGTNLIEHIKQLDVSQNEKQVAIEAIEKTITNPLQGILAGALTIQRILGSYGLAKRIIDEVLANGRQAVCIGSSFGGHIACGASRLLTPAIEEVPFEELQIGFEALIRLASALPGLSEVLDDIFVQQQYGPVWTPCYWVKKCWYTLKGSTRPRPSTRALYRASIAEAVDELEDLVEEPAIVWSFAAICIQQYMAEKLNAVTIPLFPIAKLVTIGTPAVKGAFSLDSDAVAIAYHFYSTGDVVALAATTTELDPSPNDRSVNIRIILQGTGWCSSGNPGHLELCGNAALGPLAVLIDQDNDNLPTNFYDFDQLACIDGQVTVAKNQSSYTYTPLT